MAVADGAHHDERSDAVWVPRGHRECGGAASGYTHKVHAVNRPGIKQGRQEIGGLVNCLSRFQRRAQVPRSRRGDEPEVAIKAQVLPEHDALVPASQSAVKNYDGWSVGWSGECAVDGAAPCGYQLTARMEPTNGASPPAHECASTND